MIGWAGRHLSDLKHARILKKIKAIHKKFPMYGVDPIWAEVKESSPCICNRYTARIRSSRLREMAEAAQMLI